jgi:uncharacterized membrane protein
LKKSIKQTLKKKIADIKKSKKITSVDDIFLFGLGIGVLGILIALLGVALTATFLSVPLIAVGGGCAFVGLICTGIDFVSIVDAIVN